MVNKFKCFLAIGILLAITGCKVTETTPFDEELGIAINDQGKPCYTMRDLNLIGTYVTPERAEQTLLRYYDYPEKYTVTSRDLEGNRIKITILDQFNCVVYLDTPTRGEYGHRLGLYERTDIKDDN